MGVFPWSFGRFSKLGEVEILQLEASTPNVYLKESSICDDWGGEGG